MSFEINPFALNELEILGRKMEEKDFDYITEWTKRAIRYHEKEKQKWLNKIQELDNKVKRLTNNLRTTMPFTQYGTGIGEPKRLGDSVR